MELRTQLDKLLRSLKLYWVLLQPKVKRWRFKLWQWIFLFYELVRQVTKQAIANQTSSSASDMAFNAMLSLFPALLLIVAAIGRIGQFVYSDPFLKPTIELLEQVAPEGVATVLNRGLTELAEGADRQVFSIGIVTLLWVASAFLAPVIRALNNSYDVPQEVRRPWWLNRLLAIGIFVGTVGLLLSASVMVLLGQTVLDWGVEQAGWSVFAAGIGQFTIWPLSLGAIVLALAFVYRMAPAEQPEFAPVWPGAVAGGVIWMVVSLFFRLYVRNFGRYEAIYGSIGAVIVLLLWLYLSAFGILLGGEVNAAIHILRKRHREGRLKVVGEKLLPPGRSPAALTDGSRLPSAASDASRSQNGVRSEPSQGDRPSPDRSTPERYSQSFQALPDRRTSSQNGVPRSPQMDDESADTTPR